MSVPKNQYSLKNIPISQQFFKNRKSRQNVKKSFCVFFVFFHVVRTEFLYGINLDFCDNALITSPKAVNDLLICFNSSNLLPTTPVLFTRSLPAKSIKFIFDVVM